MNNFIYLVPIINMPILPLIATEMAINMGKTTESESLQLTGELVDFTTKRSKQKC